MEVSRDWQVQTILFSFVLGVIIGIIYDVFYVLGLILGVKEGEIRIDSLKKIIAFKKKGKKLDFVIVFVLDILFFIVITPLCAVAIYLLNKGILRWYISLGTILGFLVYKHTVSKIVIQISSVITMLIKALILKFFSKIKKNIFKFKSKNKKVGHKMPH